MSTSELTVVQAYRYALDPTPRQQRALGSHCGAARFAHNWGLDLVKQRLDQRQQDPLVQVPWTLMELRREWNRVKDQIAPWWAENSKEAYASGLDNLARALANWQTSRAGRRKGRPIGFPRFKKKSRTRPSCRFTVHPMRVEPDRHHVVLPRLGRIKTHESTRKLARRIKHGTARISAATITRTADRWYVSFTVHVTRRIPPRQARQATVVGVDVGVRHLAVLSTGQVIPNLRPLERHQRHRRRLQRRLARQESARRAAGRDRASRRQRRTRRRLARLDAHIANIRRDQMHKLTTQLARQHSTIVVEELHVAGLLRRGRGKRGLSRALADTGMAELRRQLTYKSTWYGSTLIVADRFFPSSKTCSACGLVKAKLALAERVFTCEGCGLRLDRDLNAARNLARLVQDVAGSGPETQTARGGDASPGLAGQSPVKREAGTSTTLGRPGTVAP